MIKLFAILSVMGVFFMTYPPSNLWQYLTLLSFLVIGLTAAVLDVVLEGGWRPRLMKWNWKRIRSDGER